MGSVTVILVKVKLGKEMSFCVCIGLRFERALNDKLGVCYLVLEFSPWPWEELLNNTFSFTLTQCRTNQLNEANQAQLNEAKSVQLVPKKSNPNQTYQQTQTN
jgi:hypothetical protein